LAAGTGSKPLTVLYYSHPAALRHDAGPGHPEAARRLVAIEKLLAERNPAFLERREAPLATLPQIERVHPAPYAERLMAAEPTDGFRQLDPDTAMSPGSVEAALRGAGAACAAVDAVINGEARRAFVAMRPPGHHAEPDQPMGFCLFNTVAIGAMQARYVHGLGRIAIFDFDVHHGNGTQAAFWEDPETLYLSTHQMPLYPGTGRADESGTFGNIVNAPCPAGMGSAAWRQLVAARILPRIEAAKPKLVMISAGFDAHAADPLAMLNLTEEDFAWVTGRLVDLANRHGEGRVVSVLEGGYDPPALARSVLAHLEALEANQDGSA
jgi:acetoin utilization deacetylase AcuC-like enzyme